MGVVIKATLLSKNVLATYQNPAFSANCVLPRLLSIEFSFCAIRFTDPLSIVDKPDDIVPDQIIAGSADRADTLSGSFVLQPQFTQ